MRPFNPNVALDGKSGPSSGFRKVLDSVVWLLGFLALWQIGVRLTHVSDFILPAPSDFLARFYLNANALYTQGASTLELVLIGFLTGLIPALPIAYLIVAYPLLERTLYPFLVFLNVLPKIALVPLLLVWFGFGGLPKVIVTALLVFFPILVDSIAGFRSLDPRFFYLSRSMGATEMQTLRRLRLPAALPHIFSGMKISIVLAVTAVVVSEFVGSNDGLGYLILRATTNHDLPLAFAALFTAGLIGLALNFVVEGLEWFVVPNRSRQS